MVLWIVNKENVTLFVVIALGLAFFSLMFIPAEQWTFVIDWFLETPLITIIGQSVFFLVSLVLAWSFILIIKELI